MRIRVNASSGGKIPYQLVSMAVNLRDYTDPEYKNDEHEKLVDIADSLYNAGIRPESFYDEYKQLYDRYGKEYFDKILKDAQAIDSQLTDDDKVNELYVEYVDKLGGITASKKVTATEDYSYNQHLIRLSPKDKRYVLDNLNKTHRTLGLYGEPGDRGYLVSEFEDTASGIGLWASDEGIRILDKNDIEYSEVKKAIENSKKVKAKKTIKATKAGEQSYDYMLLDRLRSDCDYVLNTYDRPETPGDIPLSERELAERFLWAGNAKDQIAKMREIYNRLKVKPEWLTAEDIDYYESRFKAIPIGKQKKSRVNSSKEGKRMKRYVKSSYADDLDALDGGTNEFDPGNIYEVAVKMLPAEDIGHHASDLYIRKTPESTALLKRMRYRNSGLLTTFRSNIDGDIWYELPFCYGFERHMQEQQKANADMADFLKSRYNK